MNRMGMAHLQRSLPVLRLLEAMALFPDVPGRGRALWAGQALSAPCCTSRDTGPSPSPAGSEPRGVSFCPSPLPPPRPRAPWCSQLHTLTVFQRLTFHAINTPLPMATCALEPHPSFSGSPLPSVTIHRGICSTPLREHNSRGPSGEPS